MGKNIKVSLEAFGNKRLTVTLAPEELRGKNVSEVVNYIMKKEWQGEDKQTLEMINREITASGGYVPSIEVSNGNLPIQAQPVRLGEGIEKYVQDFGLPEEQLTLSVTGDHEVG